MTIEHPGEDRSNAIRRVIDEREPVALRTYTPTQAAIAKSAGVFHWTADGRKLYDYTSGVLVANLGHNPVEWHRRFLGYMGWLEIPSGPGYFESVPLTAYNAMAGIEADAVRRLVANLQSKPGGKRLEQVMWAASGSEAIQKALWASLAVDPARDLILATRYGFHGKKGLAEAVTGSERDKNRDPRVRFISFPKDECRDLSLREAAFDPAPYRAELDALAAEHRGIACLITEPYLGGGGSYHPPEAYLQMLQDFCREHDIVFILDEVQANFGRTGNMFAFETYGLEPDIVVLGKGLGNGVPAACAAGRADIFGALDYGEASDTLSANPLCCAAVLATLDEFESQDVLGDARTVVGDHRRGSGRAEGAAVRRPRPRRKGRHGLGRRGDGVRGEDRQRDGECLRAVGISGRREGPRGPPDGAARETRAPHRPAAHDDRGRGPRQRRRAGGVLREPPKPALGNVRHGLIAGSMKPGAKRCNE